MSGFNTSLPHGGVDAEDLLRQHDAGALARGRGGEVGAEAAAAVDGRHLQPAALLSCHVFLLVPNL